MMFARYLEEAAVIMHKMDTQKSRGLESEMQSMASEIRAGITKYGIVSHPLFGAMFAFEVDGYGSQVRLPRSPDEQSFTLTCHGRISWMMPTSQVCCQHP